MIGGWNNVNETLKIPWRLMDDGADRRRAFAWERRMSAARVLPR